MDDKFLVDVKEDGDDLIICFEWDANDPHLQWWSSLSMEQQQTAFMEMLLKTANETIEKHSPGKSS